MNVYLKKLDNVGEHFVKDTLNHQMIIKQNEGVYRHLVFKDPESSSYWFELITWPGALCISGDMGTWIFKRNTDMFTFFGTKINPGYWQEKLEAGRNESEAWSQELAENKIWANFNEWLDDIENKDDPDIAEFIEEQRERVKDDLVGNCESAETFYYAISSFEKESHSSGLEGPSYEDYWEVSCTEYTHHYLWCCNAIVWGTEQYKAEIAKAGEA